VVDGRTHDTSERNAESVGDDVVDRGRAARSRNRLEDLKGGRDRSPAIKTTVHDQAGRKARRNNPNGANHTTLVPNSMTS